jgi:curli biogenesis system outer membrane secretion channel CsgG
LSIVDVSTSEILKSYQGAGEYSLTNKEVLGFGGYAGYDSTLADKVLNLAIQEAIQRLVEGRSANEW